VVLGVSSTRTEIQPLESAPLVSGLHPRRQGKCRGCLTSERRTLELLSYQHIYHAAIWPMFTTQPAGVGCGVSDAARTNRCPIWNHDEVARLYDLFPTPPALKTGEAASGHWPCPWLVWQYHPTRRCSIRSRVGGARGRCLSPVRALAASCCATATAIQMAELHRGETMRLDRRCPPYNASSLPRRFRHGFCPDAPRPRRA